MEAHNEPRLKGDSHEWWYQAGGSSSEKCPTVINVNNQLIHIVIRNTGGNNKSRFFLFTSDAACFLTCTSNNFIFPDDSAYNPKRKKIIVSIHMHTS